MTTTMEIMISIMAGCVFMTSIYAGLLYHRFKDLTNGRVRLRAEPRYFKIVLRENDIPRECANDTGIREQ